MKAPSRTVPEHRESILAIIPARGGSKGVPGKNLRLLCGSPLIEHTIKAALEAACRPRTVLSTDDSEIAEVALAAGADVPFLRPPELATDRAPSVAVMEHALGALSAFDGFNADIVLLLQPTSPLRTARQIDEAVALHQSGSGDSVASITRTDHPPEWLRRLDPRGILRPIKGLAAPGVRRQEFPPVYRLNGAIYVTSPGLIADGRILGDEALGYVMPPEDSVDIDSELDLILAEILLERRRNRSSVRGEA